MDPQPPVFPAPIGPTAFFFLEADSAHSRPFRQPSPTALLTVPGSEAGAEKKGCARGGGRCAAPFSDPPPSSAGSGGWRPHPPPEGIGPGERGGGGGDPGLPVPVGGGGVSSRHAGWDVRVRVLVHLLRRGSSTRGRGAGGGGVTPTKIAPNNPRLALIIVLVHMSGGNGWESVPSGV